MTTFNPYTVALEPYDESDREPIAGTARLLAKLALLARGYQARPAYTQSRNGDLRESGWIRGAEFRGRLLGGGYLVSLGCEDDALDYRTEAVRLIEESGLAAETSLDLRGGCADVVIAIAEQEERR
jgi:hypothetical protein